MKRDRLRAKVQRLLEAATTDGEREACSAALDRIARSDGSERSLEQFLDTARRAVERRDPLDGTDIRLMRRFPELAPLIADYRWNPTEDVYYPAPREML